MQNIQYYYQLFFSLLKNKYGKDKAHELLKIQGIDEGKLDVFKYREQVLTKGLAETTIDPNANVGNKLNYPKLFYESYKPQEKMWSFSILYEKIKELFGEETAKKCLLYLLDGSLYLHDSTKLTYYCASIDPINLILNGRQWTRTKSRPPKRVSSFLGQLVETLMNISQDQAGALAIGSFFICLAYLLIKEKPAILNIFGAYKKPSEFFTNKLKNQLQSFCYSVNNECRTAGEPLFVNISLFDKPRLEMLLEDYNWLFNFKNENEKNNVIKLIQYLQEVFLDVYTSEPDLTFPVVTANFTVDDEGNILDEQFLEVISKYNAESYRCNIYLSHVNDFKVNLCCFSPDTKVFVKDGKTVKFLPFDEVYSLYRQKEIETLFNGKWVKALPIRVVYNKPMYKITLENGFEIKVTDNHIHLTDDGFKKTYQLKTGDYLAWTKQKHEWNGEKNHHFGYQIASFLFNILNKENSGFTSWLSFRKEALQGIFDGIFQNNNSVLIKSQTLLDQLLAISNIIDCPIKITKVDDGFLVEKGFKFTKEDKNYRYVKIDAIERIDFCYYVYCFNIKTKEHLFELPCGLITHNCRLSLDILKEREQDAGLKYGVDSYGNGVMSLASHRVVTINPVRLALLTKEPKTFIHLLEDRLETARYILLAHRKLLEQWIKQDMFIVFSYGYLKPENMFSTIGLLGLYETMELFGYAEDKQKYITAVDSLLNHVENYVIDFIKRDKVFYNVECVPAESCANTLAKTDNLFFDYKPNSMMLYSNQFVPLWKETNFIDKINIESNLIDKLSGGAIAFLQAGSKLTKEQMINLVRYCAKKGLRHFAVNGVITLCKDCNKSFFGKFDKCPECKGNNVELWSRIVGYFVNVTHFSKARQKEFWHRKNIL